MGYRGIDSLSRQATIGVGLTVVAFMSFGLALSFYRNTLFEHTLSELRAQNAELAQQVLKGHADLEYFRSRHYKDKYAKETMGRVSPGERILVILEDADPLHEAGSGALLVVEEAEEAALLEEHLREVPVIYHWELYLFHREKLHDMRRGLR